MAAFRNVELQDFITAADAVAFTPALYKAWRNLDRKMVFYGPFGGDNPVCAIHDGDLHVAGDFEAPAFHVLVRGNLIVDGIVDTNFKGADEDGTFIVTGNVHCRIFLNYFGKSDIVGGDLIATEALGNGFEDSLLYVGGAIRTRCYFGWDMGAEFGTTAEMEYGIGYCLPLGFTNANAQVVRPRFDRAATLDRLAIPGVHDMGSFEILQYVTSGQPIFR